MAFQRMSSRSNPNGLSRNADSTLETAKGVAPKRGMVLPFTPLAMSFDSVNYYVDMPAVSYNKIYYHSSFVGVKREEAIFLTWIHPNHRK